jgi:hypothetical protein
MPMTNGEKYAVFLLLAADKSALRSVIEGSQMPDGSTPNAPSPAADAAALVTRAEDALVALGVARTNLVAPVNLAYLFDTNGSNNVTKDEAVMARAINLAYGGTCPASGAQTAIFKGITQQIQG